MKTLELKKIKVKNQNGEDLQDFSFKDIALSVMYGVGAEGVSTGEMRSRFKVIDILEKAKAGQKIQLDDAHLETLKQVTNQTKWTVMDKNVFEFIEYLNSL